MNYRAATLVLTLASVCAVAPARADKIKNPTAVFAGLDKITGRIINFEVGINETVQFGSLQLTPRVCYSRPAYEAPRTDTFVEVEEINQGSDSKRIFTGWMFAASPGLSGVEHPVYDFWLTECKGGTQVIKTAPEKEEVPEVTPLQTPRPQRPPDPVARRPDRPAPPRQPTQTFYPTNIAPPPVATVPPPRGGPARPPISLIPGPDPARGNN